MSKEIQWPNHQHAWFQIKGSKPEWIIEFLGKTTYFNKDSLHSVLTFQGGAMDQHPIKVG